MSKIYSITSSVGLSKNLGSLLFLVHRTASLDLATNRTIEPPVLVFPFDLFNLSFTTAKNKKNRLIYNKLI